MAALSKKSFLPLFLAIFLDTFGGTLIVPLLGPLFFDKSLHILPGASVLELDFFYGFILGIYSLATFVGAPFLTQLSDRWGRKPVLMICLLGSCLGYLLTIEGVHIHSLALIIAGRIVDGFTAASLFTAQAAIIDISTPENKIINLGRILLAASLGYLIGPLAAGALMIPQIIHSFGIVMPLYLAGILGLINVFLLIFFFRETYQPQKMEKFRWMESFEVLLQGFRLPQLRNLCIAFFALQLGWAIYSQFIGLFLITYYHFSPVHVGLFMGCIGLGFLLGFCYLLPKLSKCFSTKVLSELMLLLLLVVITITLEFDVAWVAWLCSIPAAAGLGMGYSSLVALFSSQVDAKQQGSIMGLTGAMSALAFAFAGIGAGALAGINADVPLEIAYVCFLVGFLTLYLGFKNNTSSVQTKAT